MREGARPAAYFHSTSSRLPSSDGKEGGWSLLGEVNKWVGVSPARVRSIEVVRRHSGNASLEVAVRGAPGELVALAFAPPARTSGAWAAAVVECTVPSSGALVVAVPERSCVL